MNFISSIIALILFIYVAFATTSVDLSTDKINKLKLLKFSVRFLQVFFIVFILLLMVEIITFLSTGTMEMISSGFIDLNYAQMIEGHEVLLVVFSIIILSTNFFILELVYSILRSFTKDVRFDTHLVKAIKMITHLFVIRVLIQVFMNAVVYGSLSLSIEYVFVYALMIVLVNIFIRAAKVQEDSDLAI